MSLQGLTAPALAAFVAVTLYVAKAWVDRRDRKRQLFAEAYQWYAAYKEFPYAIRRRRGEDPGAERVRLSEAVREVQAKLDYFRVWTALEAPAVGAAYAELLDQLRLVAGGSMRQAWLEEPTSTDEGMNFPAGRVDLSALRPYEDHYLQAVRRHLSFRHRNT